MIFLWFWLLPISWVKAGGADNYNITYKATVEGPSQTLQAKHISKETIELFCAAKQCTVVLWANESGKDLIAFPFKKFKKQNISGILLGNQPCKPYKYPNIFGIGRNPIYYFIDPLAFSKDKVEKALSTTTNEDSLFLAYHPQTKVIQYMEALPEKGSLSAEVKDGCDRYNLFLNLSDRAPHSIVTEIDSLKALIRGVYKLDCCNNNDPDCLAYANSAEGCEGRALRLTRYLDKKRVDYDLLTMDAAGGNSVFLFDSRQEPLSFTNHLAVGVHYKTKGNYIVLDPTLFNYPQKEMEKAMDHPIDSFSYANWKKRFFCTVAIPGISCRPEYKNGNAAIFKCKAEVEEMKQNDIKALSVIPCTCLTQHPYLFR